MDQQKCSRCRGEEYIPTHQFVKFDNAVQYFCKECWETFRVWIFNKASFYKMSKWKDFTERETKIRFNTRKTKVCFRCKKECIPHFQHVKFDLEPHFLCRTCWGYFREWVISNREFERICRRH